MTYIIFWSLTLAKLHLFDHFRASASPTHSWNSTLLLCLAVPFPSTCTSFDHVSAPKNPFGSSKLRIPPLPRPFSPPNNWGAYKLCQLLWLQVAKQLEVSLGLHDVHDGLNGISGYLLLTSAWVLRARVASSSGTVPLSTTYSNLGASSFNFTKQTSNTTCCSWCFCLLSCCSALVLFISFLFFTWKPLDVSWNGLASIYIIIGQL